MNEKQKINEPENYGNFPVENAVSNLKFLMENENVQAAIETASVIADLGSGAGGSTQALSNLCPNAQEIHSVDVSLNSLWWEIEKELGEKGVHHQEFFHDFLEKAIESGKSFDLILIKSAPDHQLHKNKGYRLLADAMSPNSIVLEIGDTDLDTQGMLEHFELEADFGTHDIFKLRAWIKK